MKTLSITIIFLFLSFGCSKKNENQTIDSIGSKFVRPDINKPTPNLTAETYSEEALEILDSHKKELKRILPEMISNEINVYKNTLIEIEKAPAKSFSLQETNNLIKIAGVNAGNRLMKKSILLNQHYFKLFNELSILNIKYNIDNKIKFKDFYDAGPIVLSEEVLLKIDELIKDEKLRSEIENEKKKNGYLIRAINVIATVTNQTSNKEKLMNFARGIKAAKNSIILEKSTSNLAKYTSKLLNKDIAAILAVQLKNQTLRNQIQNKSEKIGLAAAPVKFTLEHIQSTQALKSFKVIANEMNGRIGDFSDGILVVHMQRVRDIIKGNKAMISKNLAMENIAVRNSDKN